MNAFIETSILQESKKKTPQKKQKKKKQFKSHSAINILSFQHDIMKYGNKT